MSLISIIIVTYNSEKHIGLCLDSIFSQGFKDYEIIVVDNASQDKTVTILKNTPHNLLLIKNQYNYGYSKALNQGIAQARGKFILCLNDDIRLENNFLTNIYEGIKKNDNVGGIQPKILNDRGKIDSAGISISCFRRFHDIGNGKINSEEFNKPKYVFGACAAASLYRKEALEAIRKNMEYFDEDFFCLVEDVDASWRLQNKGWRILYYPDAVCIHVGGISRRDSKIRRYLSMRNRYLMILKNESPLGFLRFPFVFLAYDLWRNLYMAIVNPIFFLKAVCEITRLSPRMLRKRSKCIGTI